MDRPEPPTPTRKFIGGYQAQSGGKMGPLPTGGSSEMVEWEEGMPHLHVIEDMCRASGILAQAAAEMKDRGATYDQPQGERSMGKTVAAFAAVTGVHMSEQQGWQFMELLKMVRSNQGSYRADSFVDGAAYASLAGEAAAKGKGA